LLAARILVGLFALLVPIALYAGVSSRGDLRPSSLRSVVGTFALGALAFVPAELFERALTGFSGLQKAGKGSTELAALVYAFLVAAPLEEGVKVAAASPVWRLRVAQHRPFDGVAYATAAALGFATVQSAVFLYTRASFSWIDPLRAMVAALAAPGLASLWGYALGREPRYRMGGAFFNATWAAAAFGGGLTHHLTFVRGPNALLAMIPVVLVGAVAAWLFARELLARSSTAVAAKVAPRKPRLLPISPPSLRALREALRRTERPISLWWIGIGTLVTTGVITAMLVVAVVLGRRMGIDFAAVDRDASQADAIPPLLMLAGAALLAFPFAGWIVARASSSHGVLEPAVSSLFAIGGAIVLLGLAAPVAVVIALACAPLAFGLACLGAWLGSSS
jgi:RsiW-degrading membrane proteinase PrsW (M82 family)